MKSSKYTSRQNKAIKMIFIKINGVENLIFSILITRRWQTDITWRHDIQQDRKIIVNIIE